MGITVDEGQKQLGRSVRSKESKDLLSRMWRGEVSLPVMYWLFGSLGGFLVWEGAGALMEVESSVWVLGVLFGVLYSIFVSVGIWQSAFRYESLR